MRALILTIPLIALAACSGENQGWNPNYRAEATPYGDYLRAREAALTGKVAQPPRTIPMARPFQAPTADQIAGPSPTQIIERETTAAAAGVGVTLTRRLPAKASAPALDVPPPVVYPVRVARPKAVVVTSAAPAARTIQKPAPAAAAPAATVATRFLREGRRGTCAAYPTPDAAQRAFIAQGGPQRDPLGLDPDGDGRACTWTPDRGEPL